MDINFHVRYNKCGFGHYLLNLNLLEFLRVHDDINKIIFDQAKLELYSKVV